MKKFERIYVATVEGIHEGVGGCERPGVI